MGRRRGGARGGHRLGEDITWGGKRKDWKTKNKQTKQTKPELFGTEQSHKKLNNANKLYENINGYTQTTPPVTTTVDIVNNTSIANIVMIIYNIIKNVVVMIIVDIVLVIVLLLVFRAYFWRCAHPFFSFFPPS